MAAFIAPLIGGLAGLFGGGTQQRSATQQTSSGSQTISGNTSGSTTPNLSPLQQQLMQLFQGQAAKLANPDLSGYTQGGIESINQGNAGAEAATRNMLAARGLAFSPAYSTAATLQDQNRQNQIAQFLAQIPLLQRQLQTQAIQTQEGALGPYGTSSTGTTNQTQNSTGTTTGNGALSGNPLAGLFSGLGAGLLGPNSSGSGSNLGDIINAIGFGRKQPQNIYPGGGEY